jgi:hypothetical protein
MIYFILLFRLLKFTAYKIVTNFENSAHVKCALLYYNFQILCFVFFLYKNKLKKKTFLHIPEMDTCMRYLKLFAYESKEKKLIAQKISIKTIILRLNWIYLSLIETQFIEGILYKGNMEFLIGRTVVSQKLDGIIIYCQSCVGTGTLSRCRCRGKIEFLKTGPLNVTKLA